MKIKLYRAYNGYTIYKGTTLIGTAHGERPTKANNRKARWNICWLGGRVEWFDTFKELRDQALKG